ncbi:hypothetical protein MNEG_11815 [Monoraphidium neglectum]|uniref:Uncharacterized protein n=1 Tax=Monoraphidium neglectum TaxID=145388 RepID=A0A0D2M4H2_9CHLO|nr:hypothetical protein MNEG_11815 [Monoraphidium neglectum]KIY96146.1 hypothetical protein MNEG_11815 [Monoraphidium neglectum]|eukprot:XP_013895166.1 hypothetical protein MNEG_11815 [Monoraphidium neglectum]
MASSGMISCICWVPKGAAKPVPEAAPVSEEELAAMRAEAQAVAAGVLGESGEEEDDEPSDDWETEDEEMDEQEAVAKAKAVAAALAASSSKGGSGGKTAATGDLEAALKQLDMDNYDSSDDGASGDGDDEDDDEDGGGCAAAVVARALGGRVAEGVVLDDPYLPRGGGKDDDEDDDSLSGSEREDYVIRPDDLLILAASNEDDVSTLGVWVYEEAGPSTGGEANIYPHHDILLPAFPLCMAWMDLDPSGAREKANMVAIGSMEPGIEIWDLDLIDQVEPAATLGGVDAAAAEGEGPGGEGLSREEKRKARKKAAKQKLKRRAAPPALRAGSHEGAVLGLAWNGAYRNVLASGGADGAVKVWDVAAQRCEHTLLHHSGKVQAVAWNPAEAPVLLTGSFDRTACIVDVRAPGGGSGGGGGGKGKGGGGGAVPTWKVSADVEALAWAPHAPTVFLVSSEDGVVAAYDARGGAGSKPLFRLAAHDKPACALSFCPAAPGLLATASTDKKAKLWDVTGDAPKLLASKDAGLGAIFTAGFCGADAPHLLALAGAKGTVGVWDVRSAGAVAARWPELMRDAPPEGAGAAGAP